MIEDDIVAQDNFIKLIADTVLDIERTHKCYALIIYSNLRWDVLQTLSPQTGTWWPIAGQRWIPYNWKISFYGMQAIYYPRCVLDPLIQLGDDLLTYPDDEAYFKHWYYDSLIWVLTDTYEVPLFVMTQSPVQHVGRHSGLQLGWHSSPSWDPIKIM